MPPLLHRAAIISDWICEGEGSSKPDKPPGSANANTICCSHRRLVFLVSNSHAVPLLLTAHFPRLITHPRISCKLNECVFFPTGGCITLYRIQAIPPSRKLNDAICVISPLRRMPLVSSAHYGRLT